MFGLEKNVGDPTRNFFCAIPVPQSRRSPAKNLNCTYKDPNKFGDNIFVTQTFFSIYLQC
jgi:hypothetical protein